MTNSSDNTLEQLISGFAELRNQEWAAFVDGIQFPAQTRVNVMALDQTPAVRSFQAKALELCAELQSSGTGQEGPVAMAVENLLVRTQDPKREIGGTAGTSAITGLLDRLAYKVSATGDPQEQADQQLSRFLVDLNEAVGKKLDQSNPLDDDGFVKLVGDLADSEEADYDQTALQPVLLWSRQFAGSSGTGFIPGLSRLTLQHRSSDRLANATGLNTRRSPFGDLSQGDWDSFVNAIKARRQDQHGDPLSWCSLIHSYWLDEAGLQYAVERAAARIQNGERSRTEPIAGIHLDRNGYLAIALHEFVDRWQQRLLKAVDFRAQQYEAQYGFELLASRPRAKIRSVDPRHGFSPAFHGFLHTTAQFLEASRNLQNRPDDRPIYDALRAFEEVIREGNENLQRGSAPIIRGQMEYCKGLLGGYDGPTAMWGEWQRVVTTRPGVQAMLKNWQLSAGAVKEAYRISGPSIRDYTTLAERGEQLLVMSRLLFELPDYQNYIRQFVVLLEPAIQDYIDAFKRVARIDLRKATFAGTPAQAMSRHISSLPTPLMRRPWPEIA